VKTRDKILQKSLDLFNEQGERKISTNHIAAALGISPGNLYYHFSNKGEIIGELVRQYANRSMTLLMTPEDRPMTYQDKLGYFEGILENMWDYRFLHRDLEQLMADNPVAREQYQLFAQRVMGQGMHIFQRLSESGLVNASPEEGEALIMNIWIILTSWISFLHTSGIFGTGEAITRDLLKRGIYQIIQLEAPYLTGEAQEKLPEMKARYRS
jgi:AcrR family transcriptional regulator